MNSCIRKHHAKLRQCCKLWSILLTFGILTRRFPLSFTYPRGGTVAKSSSGERTRVCLLASGDGFAPYEDLPFGSAGTTFFPEDPDEYFKQAGKKYNETDDEAGAKFMGFNPYEVLGITQMDTIDEDLLRKAFRKQAKIYHPDVPGTGNETKFLEIRKAVEQLASLERLATFKEKTPEKKAARKPKYQTVTEDFWELRARDFFTELEMELVDELKGLDSRLSNDQKNSRVEFSKSYWEEFKARKIDKDQQFLDWMDKKREQRRLMVRDRLRGAGPPSQEDKAVKKATATTLTKVQDVICAWLGMPKSMVPVDMKLNEIGFLTDTEWDDVARCLLSLEEAFEDANIIDINERANRVNKLQLPSWVRTLSDLADFIQGRL